MNIDTDFASYNEAELQRWLHLRAIEWCAWPVFLSQSVVPLLLISFSPVPVIIGVIAAEFLWRFVRYSFVSPGLASAGATFVGFTKWPFGIGAAIYLYFHHRYGVAILALIWPLIASFASAPITLIGALFGRHTLVGAVELELAKRIGYVSEEATL